MQKPRPETWIAFGSLLVAVATLAWSVHSTPPTQEGAVTCFLTAAGLPDAAIILVDEAGNDRHPDARGVLRLPATNVGERWSVLDEASRAFLQYWEVPAGKSELEVRR